MKLNHATVVQIHELIKPHLTKQLDGYWKYDYGWGDAEVARCVGNGVNSGHVARVRGKTFGNISPSHVARLVKGAATRNSNAAVLEALQRLEAKVDHLTKEVGARPWQSNPQLNGTHVQEVNDDSRQHSDS